MKIYLICCLLALSAASMAQTADKSSDTREIEAWITNADRSALFEKQPENLKFDSEEGRGLPIIINDRQQYQSIDGFGFALTEGSAFHLNNVSSG